MLLTAKTAIVTGGSSGLGEGIVERFAKEGAKVTIVGTNLTRLEKVADKVRSMKAKCIYVQGDISKEDDVKRIFHETKKHFGQVDILVNNAGITGRKYGDGPAHKCDIEAVSRIIDINIKGTLLCSKYALSEFVKQNNGVIVNMSSVLGLVGCSDYFNSHVYHMTKGAINQLTRSTAIYYAKHNVRVNSLAPGLVTTNATKSVYDDLETMEFVHSKQLLPDPITVEDVAGCAVFLASDLSSSVTGQVIAVDGGWTAQ